MSRSEIRKLRRLIEPYVKAAITIGKSSTQCIFDQVYAEESACVEYEQDDEWLSRFMAQTVIDEFISENQLGKIPKAVSVAEQKLVRVMAIALSHSLKMRSLVIDGYHPSLMKDYIFKTLLDLAVDEESAECAAMHWSLLRDLARAFGSSEHRLSRTFDEIAKEVAAHGDPKFAVFVLISNLGNRRIERMLLKGIVVSDDEANDGWFTQ